MGTKSLKISKNQTSLRTERGRKKKYGKGEQMLSPIHSVEVELMLLFADKRYVFCKDDSFHFERRTKKN